MTRPLRLLVVDDEPDLRTLYELALLREGYDVDSADSLAQARERLAAQQYSVVITDMRLPDGQGLELLRQLEAEGRPEKTLVITAYGSAENAVEALKAGAFDYLTKPVDLRLFRSAVASAVARQVLPTSPRSGQPGHAATGAAHELGEQADHAHPALARLAGRTQVMQQARALIQRVAGGMAPVLVQGESGTGKELAARAIHEVSARAPQPFVAVNCGAIPEHLLEAEFFGFRKGAFTGANEDRLGFFMAAQGGTLFLDEIGDLPLAMQSKLLRVVQERAVRPIGAVAELPVNVRIVSATHKDLGAEVAQGRFRQDLYYRLNVIQVRMPPLRERVDDLPSLCATLLARISSDAGVSPPPRLSDDALTALAGHAFPGNVRELENLLHRAVAMTGAEWLSATDLGLGDESTGAAVAAQARVNTGVAGGALATARASALVETAGPAGPAATTDAPLPVDLAAHLDQVERDILLRALTAHRFNRTAAGASLGLSLRQMRYRMARLGIQVEQASD